jgi:photosystem II stability/assembly factor-like uncharacterized protein
MKTNTWQKLISLPDGAVITGISSTLIGNETGVRNLWLCSPAGLFFEKNGTFQTDNPGLPLRSASAVLASGKLVLAAGFPSSIVQSVDGGGSWFSSSVEQIESVVSCFAASPNVSRDGIVLAGTDGEGVLRSTDSGSSWQTSNSGLRSLNVLDLACAPSWGRETGSNSVVYNYEIVFAATEAGVYMSPNAGRAWRFAGDGLPPAPVLTIAVSPDFSRIPDPSSARYRGTVFAGTDGSGLYRSKDGGQTWQAITTVPTDMTVNTMYFDAHGKLYLGTGEQGVLISADQGEAWNSLLETEDVVLCLGAHGTRLLAGTAESGLLVLENALSG